jgi:hypothetical protein
MRAIDAHTALLTYDSFVTMANGVQRAHRASLWIRGASGWVMRFHQATPCAPDGADNLQPS